MGDNLVYRHSSRLGTASASFRGAAGGEQTNISRNLKAFHTPHLFRLFLEGKGEFPGLQFWY